MNSVKRKMGLRVGVIVFLVAIAGILGISLILGAAKTESLPQVSEPTPLFRETPTNPSQSFPTDPAAEWKIYKDPKRGFMLKYPSAWYLDSPGPGTFLGVTTITSYDPAPFSRDWRSFRLTTSDLKVLLYWSQDIRPTAQPLTNWVQRQTTTEMVRILSLSEKRINSKSVLHSTEQDISPQGQGNTCNTYYIPHGDRVFIVNSWPVDSVYQSTLEGIVASIQFTDK
jgi:hypothetical protein